MSLENMFSIKDIKIGNVLSVKVVGVIIGQLKNWREDQKTGLLTVGSEDLFYLNAIDVNEHELIRVKIGVKISDDDEKNISSGFSIIVVDESPIMISISRNGAVYPIRMQVNGVGFVSLTPQRMICYLCFLCLGKYKCSRKLTDHVSRQHHGPVLCDVCGTEQLDCHELKIHKNNCFFDCGVPGCNLMHKKRNVALNHKKYI